LRLTSDEVQHIAALARVAMTDDEIERMRDEMSNILDHFDVLQQVDTTGAEPTGHSAGLESVMRDDVAGTSSPRDDILANAPRSEDGFIRVRAVLE
jgi:aspartyl-tRNA(Asn)/glutamyl-tRNA(Gln) amidotransferase subunit C